MCRQTGRQTGRQTVARPRTPAGRARRTHERLKDCYDATCALDHDNPFQLLVATILSAQCTDARVNLTTPAVFDAYPDAFALAAATQEHLEDLVHPTGFFRSKAKNLRTMAQALVERHDGEVPPKLADLVKLAGVGRKTANVIRSVAFSLPGLPVDTHVTRLAHRLDLTQHDDPVKIELALNKMLPASERGDFSLRLILHGRQVCSARKPACDRCVLADFCPAAFQPALAN